MAEWMRERLPLAVLGVTVIGAGLLANPDVTDRLRRVGDTVEVVESRRFPDEVVVKSIPMPASPGEVRGMMGHRAIGQDAWTSGASGDTLRMTFDEPALIHGVLVSVDVHPPEVPLVEVMAGVNTVEPYGMLPDVDEEALRFEPDANWLIHTSSTGASIDEHVMFPKPVRVEAGDFIGVWGWVGNHSDAERFVHPEVIVYYETAG